MSQELRADSRDSNGATLGKNMFLGMLNSDENNNYDMSLVPEEDMGEFEDVCRVIANGIDRERRNDSNSNDDDSDDDDSDDDDSDDDDKR